MHVCILGRLWARDDFAPPFRGITKLRFFSSSQGIEISSIHIL
jgi:hypothetical protein